MRAGEAAEVAIPRSPTTMTTTALQHAIPERCCRLELDAHHATPRLISRLCQSVALVVSAGHVRPLRHQGV